MDFDGRASFLTVESALKRRKISLNGNSIYLDSMCAVETLFPTLLLPDYFIKPNFSDLAARELADPGYCSRVKDFTVGRHGYGFIKFRGETDVRWLNINEIVKFGRHDVVVYEDDHTKPLVGEGLNKASEVTLLLQIKPPDLKRVIAKLKLINKKQGAHFISFDPSTCEWNFSVFHFSRFGLSEEEEADIIMDDMSTEQPSSATVDEMALCDGREDNLVDKAKPVVSHTLPIHLHLDPVKAREIKMLMFRKDGEEVEDFDGISPHQRLSSDKGKTKSLLKHFMRTKHGSSPLIMRNNPRPLIEYNRSSERNSPGTILVLQQNKDKPTKPMKVEGFKLDMSHTTPTSSSYSNNIVDAALFMGRSFRVGWGPNGMLAHSGTPLGSSDPKKILSSVIALEKVAFDNVVRDENNKVVEELIDLMFGSPLSIHRDIFHEVQEVDFGSCKLKLQKLVSNRASLPKICRNYINIIERQLEVPGLSSHVHLSLTHQVMVWELIKVLFSIRDISTLFKAARTDNDDDMLHDEKEESSEADTEVLPVIRRTHFSYWLQECVYHRVQDDISLLKGFNGLTHIFALLTGRLLDSAIELASSRGDVRLACLLSQAGGSTKNRSLVAEQLSFWKSKVLYLDFIEKDRIKIYELLAGNIDNSLSGMNLDWKRYLGLLMWYQLPPDAPLHIIFDAYKNLVDDGKAPCPSPVYIEEGHVEGITNSRGEKPYDIAYYLLLLHASDERKFRYLKTMFSAFCSTPDPFDFHMIWPQQEVLEAVGIFTTNDLNLLDMGIVNQLLCVGLCHWAIYVVLHMPYDDDCPYLQPNVIKEILFQYCEIWSSQEVQRQFIEDLGIPLTWLHEALAVYFSYHRDLPQAMHHFIKCEKWQEAHSIFITVVAPPLFLSGNNAEILEISSSMEDHKSEIAHWDLGAGIYVSFYHLKYDLEDNPMTESDCLQSKNAACREFFGCLNESLAILDSKLPINARVVYSQMAEQISSLLLANGEAETREVQFACFETVFDAPVLGDTQSSHLQNAVSLFTTILIEKTR